MQFTPSLATASELQHWKTSQQIVVVTYEAEYSLVKTKTDGGDLPEA